MLILTRRMTETLVIGGRVTLTVLDIKGSRVRFGVKGPPDVEVKREEIFQKPRRGSGRPTPASDTPPDTAP
jgi:carbon storage regulator